MKVRQYNPNYNSPVRPRFFAPDLSEDGSAVSLPIEEGRHLARVLRLVPGAIVTIFDGRGNEFLGRVEHVRRDVVRVVPIERIQPTREAAVSMTLAQAVLKGDKMDAIISDATMLGVACVRPIVTKRTNVSLAALRRGRSRERWQRIAIASAKQCGRAVVPAIAFPETLSAFLPADDSALRLTLVEPARRDGCGSLERLAVGPRPVSATVAVGPEGGWTDEEIEASVAAGCVPVTLGERTFRADTVSVVAIAILRFIWKDL